VCKVLFTFRVHSDEITLYLHSYAAVLKVLNVFMCSVLATSVPVPPNNDTVRFIDHPEFTYQDFVKIQNAQPTFRIQVNLYTRFTSSNIAYAVL
jgi:hypothetical protein